jgi:hypothetical protein
MGGKGSGRKAKFHDQYHALTRENQRSYYRENREAILLGMKLHISVAEARKRLGIKHRPKKHGW